VNAKAPVILLALFASSLVPMLIGNVYASGCATACQVTVNSNVPSADGTVWIQIDNGTGNYCGSNPCTVALSNSSPPTFNFADNTIHTFTVLNTTVFTGPSSGGHYVWKEWDIYYGTASQTTWTSNPMIAIGPILYNYTGTAGLTAVFSKQYPATLTFNDAIGNPLTLAPTSLTLLPQGSSTNIITSYTGQNLAANQYTVISAHWEGTDVTPLTTQVIDLQNGPITDTISLKAYPETINIVDSNSPVQGANVTIAFVNATSRTYVSNSKGQVNLGDIPNGSFGATVDYQNQAYGPYSLTAVDNPTNTLKVNASTPTTTTTTAIVLLAIFGIAFFSHNPSYKGQKTRGST
jgi:hypothetical protein